jgi:histidinol-phosphate aminotransferase
MSVNLNRRSVLTGLVGGAVSLALAPGAAASVFQVGPREGIVRLTSNENPYGPSPRALEAARIASTKGAYYPGEIYGQLFDVLGERNGVEKDNLILSSGSNEGLCAALVAWGKEGKILTAGLTYDNHIRYAEAMGVEMVRIPLKADMSIDLEAIEQAVDDSISLVYICNPNNPTGLTISGAEMRRFCNAVSHKAVVLVDEAYNELTNDPDDTSVLDLVKKGDNVIVMRTFSKLFGMAGMRVGYGMAPPELAKKVNTHVMAWPNVVGMAAALVSYTDDEFIEFSTNKIVEGREIVNETFRRNGIEPLPSQTNFVYADIGQNATEFAARMAEHKVQIHRLYPGYENYSRVSMGKIEDLQIFADVFDKVYRS